MYSLYEVYNDRSCNYCRCWMVFSSGTTGWRRVSFLWGWSLVALATASPGDSWPSRLPWVCSFQYLIWISWVLQSTILVPFLHCSNAGQSSLKTTSRRRTALYVRQPCGLFDVPQLPWTLSVLSLLAEGLLQTRFYFFVLHTKKDSYFSIYSFLSAGWGFISDVDIESEKLRWMGDTRCH